MQLTEKLNNQDVSAAANASTGDPLMTTEQKQEKELLHLFIDADLVAYRTAAGNQKKDANGNMVVNETKFKEDIDSFFRWLIVTLCPDKMTLCFTDKTNYRKSLNRHYKSGRGERPALLPRAQEYMKSLYPTLVLPGLEADDIMGLAVTQQTPGEKRVIVSYDKDLRTIPDTDIYDTLKQEWISTTQESADRMFWTQCITGDRTDGYFGLPGIGEKGAVALVENILALEGETARVEKLVSIYESYYLDREYALRQCQMAYILRKGDYKKGGRIRLFGTNTFVSSVP